MSAHKPAFPWRDFAFALAMAYGLLVSAVIVAHAWRVATVDRDALTECRP